MNDEQMIWEAYSNTLNNKDKPRIIMINPSEVHFTEKDQERGKIDSIKKSYGDNYNDIEWEEQPKPIVSIDEDNDMYVEDGHHRITAFMELKYPSIPVIIVPKKQFNILKNKYGLQKASKMIADELGDPYTTGQDSYQ